jgi:hypothetical protein
MLMRHFGGGIGHLSHVLPQDSESSDSDSAVDTDSESNLHSAGEGGFENSDSASVSSTSSESSLHNDSEESDLDSGDNGYDSF